MTQDRHLISPTGVKFRLTIATKPMIQSFVRKDPNKIFFAVATGKSKINKAYICYNTEYHLPEGWTRDYKYQGED